MYVILVYDIHQKRVGKALKICRKYLIHIQKSVFEGNITESKLKALKEELGHLIDTQMDSVIIYHLRRWTKGYTIKQPNMDCQPTEITALMRHRAVFS